MQGKVFILGQHGLQSSTNSELLLIQNLRAVIGIRTQLTSNILTKIEFPRKWIFDTSVMTVRTEYPFLVARGHR